jgi:hypothetical protein
MAIRNAATLELMALRLTDPPAYRKRIRDALAAHGSVPAAAVALDMPVRTLQTWVSKQTELSKGIALQAPGNPDFGPGFRRKRKAKRTGNPKST